MWPGWWYIQLVGDLGLTSHPTDVANSVKYIAKMNNGIAVR